MSTPHIKAEPGDFAPTVLMPGDPLRSQYIAENFLTDAKLVNNVRGVQGYTGFYDGTRVSVMASGMGIPSIGIYSYELYHFFGVENIIRIGSAGGLQENVGLRDIVIGLGACTNSNFSQQFTLPGNFAPICDYGLLCACTDAAKAVGANYHVGNMLSTDTFYDDEDGLPDIVCVNAAFRKMGVLAVEMEAAGLYMTAARCGKKALAICTVTDLIGKSENLSSDERRASLNEMVEIALRTAKAVSG